MRSLRATALLLVLQACTFHRVTTIRERELIEVVEITPASLPEDPARAPGADKVTVILHDLRQQTAVPGSLHRETTTLALRASPREPELRLDLTQVKAIHFTRISTTELSRHTESRTTPQPGTIAVVIVGTVVVVVLTIVAVAPPQIDVFGGGHW